MFGISLLFILAPEKKPKGILDTVLTESDFAGIESEKKPVIARVVSEFSQDKFGQMIETKKGFSESNELLEEVAYKGDKKFGQSYWYKEGKIITSSWYYDVKGRRSINISYDASGKVKDAQCSPRMRFTEEHEKICGWKEPFSYVSTSLGGKLEVTLDKGVQVVKKQFYAKGGIWIDEKVVDEKRYRDTYHENGKIRDEHVTDANGWTHKKYNFDGLLLEKQIGFRKPGPYREEAIIYDQNGKEVALWEVHKKTLNNGFRTEGCTLKRSLASEAPRPSVCP